MNRPGTVFSGFGFDQNQEPISALRDSGKRNLKYLGGKRDFPGSRIRQNLGTRCGTFFLSVGNSGNYDDSNTLSSGKCDSTRQASSLVYLLSTKQTIYIIVIWLMIV